MKQALVKNWVTTLFGLSALILMGSSFAIGAMEPDKDMSQIIDLLQKLAIAVASGGLLAATDSRRK